MMLEKEKIRRIIRDHKITSFHETDEKELVDIFYETLVELGHIQEEKLATKEDIKMVLEMMEKRFEAVDKRFEAVDRRFESVDKRFEDLYRYMDKRFESIDKRFEDMNKKFTMMFTFMNIGFGLLVLLTVLFKFLS
jgi:hypothetical protein